MPFSVRERHAMATNASVFTVESPLMQRVIRAVEPGWGREIGLQLYMSTRNWRDFTAYIRASGFDESRTSASARPHWAGDAPECLPLP